MTFKDMTPGYSVFVISRADIKMGVGKVVSVSPSRIDSSMGNMDMVIDITIDMDGKNTTYVVKESSCIASSGTITIAVDRETALREVEGIKTKAEGVLATMEEQRRTVDACNSILVEYNPTLKKEQEADKRMTAIEDKLERLLNTISAKL